MPSGLAPGTKLAAQRWATLCAIDTAVWFVTAPQSAPLIAALPVGCAALQVPAVASFARSCTPVSRCDVQFVPRASAPGAVSRCPRAARSSRWRGCGSTRRRRRFWRRSRNWCASCLLSWIPGHGVCCAGCPHLCRPRHCVALPRRSRAPQDTCLSDQARKSRSAACSQPRTIGQSWNRRRSTRFCSVFLLRSRPRLRGCACCATVLEPNAARWRWRASFVPANRIAGFLRQQRTCAPCGAKCPHGCGSRS